MNSDQFWFAGSIVVLSAIAAVQVLKLLKRRRARTWPQASAQVVSTDLRLRERGENQSVWMGRVDYQYEVQEHAHTGFIERSFLLKGRADKWAGRFTTGRALTVRVNPHNPADSVLLENEQS
jgi:Protein of unknown function (DUF3592)